MDQRTLVEEQINDGRTLIDRLREDGFEVTAACWLHESGSGRWYLYLASPVVDAEGPHQGYLRFGSVIRRMPPSFSIGPFDVKLVEARNPLVRDVAELHRQYAGRSFLRHGGPQLGDVSIEGAYVYMPIPATVP